MRAPWILCVLLAGVAEAAPPLKPKPAPPALSYSALRSFTEALVHEREGDLDAACRAFEAVNDKSPTANAYFNLGRLHLQQENISLALEMFDKYLELAPKAERAEVEALIAKIGASVFPVQIWGIIDDDAEPAAATILVDGVVVGMSPLAVDLARGRHEIERITATTYAVRSIDVTPGRRDYVSLNGHGSEKTGNVIITGLGSGSGWTENGIKFERYARFGLPVGRYSVTQGGALCKPFDLVVTSTRHLTHVRVDVTRSKQIGVCDTLVGARMQILRLGAP